MLKHLRILASLGLFGLFMGSSERLWAGQWAQVTATQATVYADKQLTSPIGVIKQGKKIKVGNVVRRYGTILPTVVASKVVYIQVKDIQLEADFLKQQEEDEDREKDKGKDIGGFEHKVMNDVTNKLHDNLSENNHLSLIAGQGSSSGDMETFSKNLGQSHPNTTFVKLAFEHRPQFYRTSWSVGLGYEQAAGTRARVSSNSIDLNIYYALLKTGLLNIEANFGMQVLPQIRIESPDTNPKEVVGSGWGYQLGGRAVLFPHAFLSFFGEIKLMSTKYANFDNIEFSNGSTAQTLDGSSTTLALVGISFGI
jgi:hypothetical protein